MKSFWGYLFQTLALNVSRETLMGECLKVAQTVGLVLKWQVLLVAWLFGKMSATNQYWAKIPLVLDECAQIAKLARQITSMHPSNTK